MLPAPKVSHEVSGAASRDYSLAPGAKPVTHTFIIHDRLPGLNEIIGAARQHYHSSASQKKKYTQLCSQYVRAGRVPRFERPVTLEIHWIEPDRRRDIDNITGGGTKFVLDALVEMECLKGDGQRWVTGLSHTFGDPDKRHPRIHVTIKENEGE